MKERVRPLNDAAIRQNGRYVLYWSQMNRRAVMNQALDYAVMQANSFGIPVLFYEGLTCSYPWANDRLHTFILEGVPYTSGALAKLGIGYCFYLRRRKSDTNDNVYRLAKDAALVVTDDYPTFVAAKHNATVPEKTGVAFHAVDASCIVPMNRLEKREYAAYTIRPKIQRLLAEYLYQPSAPAVLQRWIEPPPAFHRTVAAENIPDLVASSDIDHSVRPSTSFRGGYSAAR